MSSFLDALKNNKYLVSDGAMGTELQKRGLPTGQCPEEFNISHPQVIKSIYADYYNSGSDIVTTNTFGGSRMRLKFHGFENRVKEFNRTAVELAAEVKPDGKFIAGDIGPLGELIEPLGDLSEQAAYDAFAEQAEALAEAGADIIFIETMMAIEEITLAVKAVKENTKLPVSATMTFELGNAGLRTAWGVDVESAVKTLESLGVDVLGSNCGRGFDEMVEVVKAMKLIAAKPILAQANAGLPEWVDGVSVYKETPEVIAPKVEKLLSAGTKIIGGCCGTNPSHIRMIRDIVDRLS